MAQPHSSAGPSGAAHPPRMRIQRRPVHGVLLLDKPLGLSSNDALQKVKWLLRAEKAGHTGTLDPLATGLLPLCFGAATKFSQVSLGADKSYEATLRLGLRTDSGDAEGQVLEQRAVQVSREQVNTVIERYTGEIDQIPPMQSALKKDGRPLYDYARRGLTVARDPRRVRIHALQAQWLEDDPQTLMLRVRCSKGTYIRTLADDIGQALGCGASLVALRRTASGPLHVDEAVTLPELEAMDEAQRLALLRPADVLLADWAPLLLNASEAGRFLTGLRRRVAAADCDAVRVYGPPADDPLLLGSAHIKAGELIPDRLLSPAELQSQRPSAARAVTRPAA